MNFVNTLREEILTLEKLQFSWIGCTIS